MYIIKNVSTHDVTVPDLRVTLTPGEKIDLDMVTSRFYIDQSSMLRGLFRANKLQCIMKDTGVGGYEVYQPQIEVQQPVVDNSQSVIDVVKKLEEKLAKRLDEKVQNTQPQVDINALNQVLQNLQAIVGQGSLSNVKTQQNTQNTDIDDSKMIDIQKRTVNRLVNKAESKVTHDEQTTDKDVNRNLRELEDLL